MQHGFYFDHQRCVKCHACEIAYPDVQAMNVSMACMHCGDAPCRNACPVSAITKRAEDGIVVVDPNKCIGCGFCAWACPFNAPQLSASAGKMQKCNFCQTPGRERPLDMPRACEEICPTGAIRSGPMTELGGMAVQGFPGLMVQAQQSFGPGGGDD